MRSCERPCEYSVHAYIASVFPASSSLQFLSVHYADQYIAIFSLTSCSLSLRMQLPPLDIDPPLHSFEYPGPHIHSNGQGPHKGVATPNGKSSGPFCICSCRAIRIAAHLLVYERAGDGQGRTFEVIWNDRD